MHSVGMRTAWPAAPLFPVAWLAHGTVPLGMTVGGIEIPTSVARLGEKGATAMAPIHSAAKAGDLQKVKELADADTSAVHARGQVRCPRDGRRHAPLPHLPALSCRVLPLPLSSR